MKADVKRQLERFSDRAAALDVANISVKHAMWHEEILSYLARFDKTSQKPGNRVHDKDAGVYQYFLNAAGSAWSGFFDENGEPNDKKALAMCRSQFAKAKGALAALLDGGDPNLFLASLNPGLALLELMLNRFHVYALSVNHELRKGQCIHQICNEYDVDRHVYAMAKMVFANVQFEDPSPKRAGQASRVDFYIAEADVFIENKFVKNANVSKIRSQIAEDIDLYRSRDDAHKILFFIYDPEVLLINHAELDELKNTNDIVVEIIVSPGLAGEISSR